MEKAPRKKSFFSVARWAPVNEALVRAKEALSSSDLAERDLHEHLRSGRLLSSMRRIERDGSEIFARVKPPFWNGLTLMETHELGSDGLAKRSGKVQVRGLDVKFVANAKLWFFVARSDLYRLYPVGGARADTEDSEHAEDGGPSARRKPGKKLTNNWRVYVAAELARYVEAGKPLPSAKDLAEYCQEKWGNEPDISDIHKLIRFLF